MYKASAYASGHITGFVEFPVRYGDPLSIGSRGAGVCIDRGVISNVMIRDSNTNKVKIYINGMLAEDAEVSRFVVENYLNKLDDSYEVIVDHRLNIPIGYGLGSSGSAALSLSLALNAIFKLFNNLKAAQIAHLADLYCKCGMGTVIAEYHGGVEMRVKAGAPGIGEVRSIKHGKDDKVVILCSSPVSTREFLTSKISYINGLGGKMLAKLENEPSIDNLLELSLRFARSIGFGKRLYNIIDMLSSKGYKASLAMFGETIFTIVKDNEVDEVTRLLASYGEALVCSIGSKPYVIKHDT